MKGVRVVITGASGAPILDATIPGGLYDAVARVGWKRNAKGTAFTYRNKSATLIQGITAVSLRAKASVPGTWKFSVSGKNGTYPVAAAGAPVRGAFIIDAPIAATGQCGESVFPGPASPACAFTANGATLRCK